MNAKIILLLLRDNVYGTIEQDAEHTVILPEINALYYQPAK